MKRIVSWGCSLSLLALCTWGCAPAAKTEHLGYIMPGKGIKDLSLHEERTQVEAAWGQPDDVYSNPFDAANVIVAYHQKGVEISYRSNRVDCVNLYPQQEEWQSYEGATQDGIWVMSKEKDVRQILGSPSSEAPQALNYPGLTVYVKDGKVNYLTVSPLPDEAISAADSRPSAAAEGVSGRASAAEGSETLNLQEADNPAADSIEKLRRSAKEINDNNG
ncbi:MAG: hypothetical protein Q4F00_01280 [bacterium]|nr:hypothetical protein [bacterium]